MKMDAISSYTKPTIDVISSGKEGISDAELLRLPNDRALQRMIQHVRQPIGASSVDKPFLEIEWLDFFTQTKQGNPFLLVDSRTVQPTKPPFFIFLAHQAFEIYNKVKAFIFEEIFPLEKELMAFAESDLKWTRNPQIDLLKQKARGQGLWNLFITVHLDPANKFGGVGLSNSEYAHVCELTGYSMFAPEVFNCSAPDTGNMEVLIKYGTPAQQTQFLAPLLEGRTRSCFAMTEPDVASSDATNIQGSIVRDDKHYVINARKWFTSGAADPNCKCQSMLLVPFESAGIQVVRSLKTLGLRTLLAVTVRTRVRNSSGKARSCRIHHCMRLIGHAERALHLMKQRVEQARLLVLKAAHMIDTVGAKAAASEIAMIKVVAPEMAGRWWIE
uniref:Acyl-CoA dehydrogenase n=1 Tax=Ditylenchus dipsaci TaxID=166011 RepID=A0A915ECC5_9BILA